MRDLVTIVVCGLLLLAVVYPVLTDVSGRWVDDDLDTAASARRLRAELDRHDRTEAQR